MALWQANHVADRLRPVAAPRPVELVEIETSGDRIRDAALSQIGGDGVFTKEIQRALLGGAVDVAVHSLKDLPTTYIAGLTLAAVPGSAVRAATYSIGISITASMICPKGAVVGTEQSAAPLSGLASPCRFEPRQLARQRRNTAPQAGTEIFRMPLSSPRRDYNVWAWNRL